MFAVCVAVKQTMLFNVTEGEINTYIQFNSNSYVNFRSLQ